MRGRALALAALWGVVSGVALYAAVRVIEHALFPTANPATVIWAPHSGYFWRLWTAMFGAGMGTLVAYAIHRAAPDARDDASVRALSVALPACAAALVVQAALVP